MDVKILQFENYLEAIRKSVDSKFFQTTLAEIDGEKKDITNHGQYSCASHVSGILILFTEFGLLKARHVGLSGLIKDMEESGWYKIDKPRIGSILQWERMHRRGTSNNHIGFYIGDQKAVCNDPDEGIPIVRHYTFGEKNGEPVRKIEAIYWHPRLDNKYFQEKLIK